jgi:hypothetical protein
MVPTPEKRKVQVACPLHAGSGGDQGGIAACYGQGRTGSDQRRSRSGDREPKSSKLVSLIIAKP